MALALEEVEVGSALVVVVEEEDVAVLEEEEDREVVVVVEVSDTCFVYDIYFIVIAQLCIGGMRGGKNVVVEPHRHNGNCIDIAKIQ